MASVSRKLQVYQWHKQNHHLLYDTYLVHNWLIFRGINWQSGGMDPTVSAQVSQTDV